MKLWHGASVGGRWIITYQAGRGKAGGAVYGAKDHTDPEGQRAALKFPLRTSEALALKALYADDGSPLAFGLPRLLDLGEHYGGQFAAMELLGRPLSEIFRRFECAVDVRWRALRILGRLLLRRLAAVHARGYVHCDIQPSNIVMGRAGDGDAGFSAAELAKSAVPYLVDFGSAQTLPGPPKRADYGTVEFASIRSAAEGPRGPTDDLESLGWVLLYGLFNGLPWFSVSKTATWNDGAMAEEERPVLCGAIAAQKARLLDEGANGFGRSWARLAETPAELLEFLRACRAAGDEVGKGVPDYAALAACLGASESTGVSQAQDDWQDVLEVRAALDVALPPSERAVAVDDGASSSGDSDGGPEGTWLFNQGKSWYTISRCMGRHEGLYYEQPLANGTSLHGDVNFALEEGEDADWTWEATLSNNGRIRLRRSGTHYMESSYSKPTSQTWCRTVVSKRHKVSRKAHGPNLWVG